MWQQPRATESSKLQETESIGQLSALAGFCRAAEGMDWEFSGDGSWCWGDSGSSGQECFGHQTLIGGWLYCQLAFRQTFSHNLLRIPSSFHMVSKVDNRRSGEPLLSREKRVKSGAGYNLTSIFVPNCISKNCQISSKHQPQNIGQISISKS